MKPKRNVIRFGGISLIISGILFFVQYLFFLPVPAPPMADADLLVWLREWKFQISMADEVLLFAAVLLIPGILALYRVLVKAEPVKTWLGCGLLAVTVPVYVVLDIILGRLVYPVYDLELSPDIYKLVISMYYGGMHIIAIIMSGATIILSFVIRRSGLGKLAAYSGFVVGAADLVGAYPWITGTAMMFVTQVFFAAWFVLVGIKLMGREVNG